MSAVAASVLCLCCFVFLASAQNKDTDKIEKAVKRSEAAAQTFEAIINLGDKSISKELLDKAEAIAVFPNLTQVNVLLDKISYSHGLVCRRTSNGWSLPAYYSFKGGSLGLSIAEVKSLDVVMLFMTEESVQWLIKKAFALDGKKRAFSGTIGTLTKEQRSSLADAHIIMYSFNDKELTGVAADSGFFSAFGVSADNNINKAVYDLKASDILLGKLPDKQSPAEGINKFTQTLTDYAAR